MTPAQKKKWRKVETSPSGRIIRNMGDHVKRLIIGHPTLGTIRYEWHQARAGIIIPVNWQAGTLTATHYPQSIAGVGFAVDDAQNVIVDFAYHEKYEWILLYEDDVLPPSDAFLKLSKHMTEGKAPIVSGLYYSKGNPSWPLMFRGRGNGAFTDFTIGDQVWCDGVPTGFLLIHQSIFRHAYDLADPYILPDGKKVRKVFHTPRDSWHDPEQDRYFTKMGTSDLNFCDWIRENKVLERTGWKDLAKEKYPFLVDTSIYCEQIDLNGLRYPEQVERLLTTGEKVAIKRGLKRAR